MLFKLAWRNIWRNKRRTAITAASIMFAVCFSVFMEAMQKGAWDNLISNVVNFYYGYAQVHQKGYWEEQSLEKAFVFEDSLKNLAEEIPSIQAVIPRIESFALASAEDQTTGALVIGIDPEKEHQMTKLQDRLIEGTYLEASDQAVLMASGVAEKLKLSVGDTLVLISSGYHGVNAAGKYPIKGLVEFGSPQLNKQMIYLPLKEAQWFYGADNLVTSLAFHLKSPDHINRSIQGLEEQLDTAAYEIMNWEQMLPDLLEARTVDSGGNVVVYFILYMIIGFGIFGTILMMTKEREYEFGVLISIGMRRFKLSSVVWLEIVLLSFLGAMLGILVSIPLVLYFNFNPIELPGNYSATMEQFGFEAVFPTAFRFAIFSTQVIVVLIITAVLGLYPMWKLRKLKPVDAMRA